MRVALVTTTIGDASVLRLYRRAGGPNVRIIIAGDQKSPHSKLDTLCDDLGNAEYLGPVDQEKIAPRLSELTGWGSIQRRNFATLEALRWGADIIITVDDDNAGVNVNYFDDMRRILGCPFTGLVAAPSNGWWSAYHQYPHRGFPHNKAIEVAFAPVAIDLNVGVAAGICLGNPDVDAYTRMAIHPEGWGVGEVTRNGYVVLPDTHTVFNSQNTAFIRQLAPAMFMLPGIGRYDDIFASLVTQRIMRETAHVTHFGKPFVWQQRNQHDLVKDLKAEIFGMEHVAEFAEWLDGLQSLDQLANVTAMVRAIHTNMPSLPWMPPQAIEAGRVWCDDVKRAMA